MGSDFDAHLRWQLVHAHARTMLNRLSAIAAQLELVSERDEMPPSVRAALESMREECMTTAREAKGLVENASARLQSPATIDVAAVMRETLAALQRYARRRETNLEIDESSEPRFARIEPELLRSSLATTAHALFMLARPGETLRTTTSTRADRQVLSTTLSTNAPAPASAPLEAELAGVRTWLELRGGALLVRRSSDAVVIAIEVPSAPPPGPC
jgi:hypothetical protein